MSQVVHIQATVQEDGKVVVERLPFRAGERVEVTVAGPNESHATPERYPLRGTVIQYDDPFGPACPPEDWDMLR